MKNMEKLQRLPFKARKAVFEKLEQIVDIAAMSKEDRMKYEASLKVYRDQLVTIEYARQQGFAEGEAEERLRNARGVKAAGIAPDLIAQIMELPLETVEGL